MFSPCQVHECAVQGRLATALGDELPVVLGEHLRVDQPLLVDVVEPLDGCSHLRLVGGEEHLVVDHHAVTLGVDHAEDRHQLLDIAAKHAERDLVAGIAIAVHVMVAEVGQRGLELVDVGGNPHAGLLQPAGVDVESDRAAPDPAAPAVRQRIDVAARGGGGEPGLRHPLEQRGDVGRPLVD